MASGVEVAGSRRTVMLAILNEFNCPVGLDDLVAHAAVFTPDVSMTPCDPVRVLESEAIAWRSGRSGPIWICPALTSVNATADYGHLTRSDWSLECRLTVQNHTQARHAWLVRVLCDGYLVAEELGLPDLRPIAARIRYHSEYVASDLPKELAFSLEAGEPDGELVEALREAAEDLHAILTTIERPALRRMVQALEHIGDYRRLFGGLSSC